MDLMVKSVFQSHPFYLVSPSPWPIFKPWPLFNSITLAILTTGVTPSIYYTFLLIASLAFVLGLQFNDFDDLGKSNLFVTKQLTSGMIDLLDIIKEIDKLMPQLESFISNFNTTIATSGINVITDSTGNMEIDVSSNLSDDEVKKNYY